MYRNIGGRFAVRQGEKLIDPLLEGEPIELNELVSGLQQFSSRDAKHLADPPLSPIAESIAVRSEGEMHIEELGGGGHLFQKVIL